MIIYCNSSNSGEKYIGGKLYDFYDEISEYEDLDLYNEKEEERARIIDDYILNFSEYYILYRPDNSYYTFELAYALDLVSDMWDSMDIKDGVNLINHGNYLEAIGYYNSHEDKIYLYPVSDEKATELSNLIDNADFGESYVIENEIAQYTWNGASVEDVLLSWSNK